MSYPLRLPQALDLAARERCAALGISLNAFVCVALDAYLRGGLQIPLAPAPPPPRSPADFRKPRRGESPEQYLERARAAGIPDGWEHIFDPEGYAECIGPDAVQLTQQETDALIDEWVEKVVPTPKPKKPAPTKQKKGGA